MSRKWKFCWLMVMCLLIILNGGLYFFRVSAKRQLEDVREQKMQVNSQRKFIETHNDDLVTIKELKQEILGQETKLKEFSTQIKVITEILIKNQEKLEELEK